MPVVKMTMESIQCTVRSCTCDCFCPGKTHQLRICDNCEHGWVVHAIDKMAYRTPAHQVSGQSVEVVQPNIVFDIASLILYGAQATPIRLKILLDRLFSVVQHDEVVQVLHSFGWSYEDYARGYILHDSSGRVLDKWSVASYEEEQLIMQQFMRFGETKAIALELIARDGWDQARQGGVHCLLGSRTESDIKKFIERSNVGMQSFIKGYDAAQQLLSRTFMYPHLATTGFARLLAPTILHNLQPPPPPPAVTITARDKPGLLSPITPSTVINPLSRSPLRSLQTMEPFDYRKESIASPMTTLASASMVSASPKLEGRALLNLAISGQASAIHPMPGSHLMIVKAEIPEETTPKGIAKEANQLRETTSSEGAINYSIKDMRIASSASIGFPNPSSSIVSQASIAVAAAAAAAAAAANNPNSSIFAHQKLKHLRKSSNPMKRPWQPTPGYGGTLISPSGKKRVLCTACHKTFCDKGALKIHYSAVHLKEMHRCTVDGCTMMFSSRRSRNRHSANPNPKLHMPQTVRRKLPDSLITSNQEDEEDDDNAFTSHPISIDQDEGSGSEALIGFQGFNTQHPNPVVLDAMSDSSEADSTITDTLVRPIPTYPLSAASRLFLNPVVPVVSVQDQVLLDGTRLSQSLGSEASVQSTADQDIPEDVKVNEGEPKEALDTAMEVGQCRSSSKRKSAVPTRCSLQTNELDSDGSSEDEPQSDKRPCRTCSHRLTPGVPDGSVIVQQKSIALEGLELSDDIKVDDSMISPNEPLGTCEVPSSTITCVSVTDRVDHQDPIQENRMVDEGMASQGPQTITPSSTVVSFPSHLIEVLPLCVTSQSDPVAGNLSSACGGDCEEMDRIESASERTSRDMCEINDSGVADLKFHDESDDVDEKYRTCAGSHFQAHFGSSSPFANPDPAHTKYCHTCIVKGCNATFPSKRSRDRHSANFNLHRRLLSTAPKLEQSSSSSPPLLLLLDESTKMATDVPACSVGCGGMTSTGIDTDAIGTVLNLSKNVQTSESLNQRTSSDLNEGNSGAIAIFAGIQFHEMEKQSPAPPSPSQAICAVVSSMEVNDSESGDSAVVPSSDPSGSVVCHVCQEPFRDNLALKEHQEQAHPKEMYRCTITGCDKIFSTRKSRNRHSQNENLHKHLLVTAAAASAAASSLSSTSSARQLAL